MFDTDLKGKKVIVRVDFNVPLDSDLHVSDDTRIRAAVPTIQALLSKGAKVILMSHLGRPLKDLDEAGNIKAKYSLRSIVNKVSENIGREVVFISTPLTESNINDDIDQVDDHKVILLENTRFYKGEEKGDRERERKEKGKKYGEDALHGGQVGFEGVSDVLSIISS